MLTYYNQNYEGRSIAICTCDRSPSAVGNICKMGSYYVLTRPHATGLWNVPYREKTRSKGGKKKTTILLSA